MGPPAENHSHHATACTLAEIRQAEQMFESVDASTPSSRNAHLRAFMIFLASQSHLLRFNPGDLIPIAHNHASHGPVVDRARVLANRINRVWVARVDRPPASELMPARLLTIPEAGSKIRISDDGTLGLATNGSEIFVWHLKTGALIHTVNTEGARISDLALSANGLVAVFIQTNGTLLFCNVDSGALWKHEDAHDFSAAAISADGGLVAARHANHELTTWDVKTGTCIGRFPVVASEFALTADGKKIVCIRDHAVVEIINAIDGTLVSRFNTGIDSVSQVFVSADGGVVATTHNNMIAIWDAASGLRTQLIKICDERSQIEAIALTPDAHILATVAGAESGVAAGRSWNTPNKLQIWDTSSGECVRTLTSGTRDFALSNDGRVVASTDNHGDLHVWNPVSVDAPDWERKDSIITSDVVVSPDFQTRMVLVFNDVRLESAHGEALISLQGHSGDLTSAAWSPDGCLGLTGALDYRARVWDTNRGQLLRSLREGDYVNAVGFNADGRLAICGSRMLNVWDLATGENIKTLSISAPPITALAVSPDDKFVVAGNADCEVCIWSLSHSKPVQSIEEWEYQQPPEELPSSVLKAHDARVLCIALTPDGRRAVSSSADGVVFVWDLVSGRLIHSLAGHTGLVRRVVITPDASICLTASEDATVRIWDLRSGACRYVYRTERKVISVSSVRADGTFFCATTGEALRNLCLRGVKLREPIVTATRLFRFTTYLERPTKSAAYDEPMLGPGDELLGVYESVVTARCAWCGERFNVAASIMETINSIASAIDLDGDSSPCLNYPEEVWNEAQLLNYCPNCTQPLRFNPFVVDRI